MKVLMLNGSMHANGTTFHALEEIGKTLVEEGIEYEIFQIGNKPIRDCIACGKCSDKGCIFDDVCNQFIAKAKEADGFIFGTLVYYAHPSGRILSLLDRAFYSCSEAFQYKPAASVACARRAGTDTSYDVLNKYFGISNMPIVSSTYWNNVFGSNGADTKEDKEGLQTMRNLARNMAWMLRCLEAGKNAGVQQPTPERNNRTNFIQHR